MRAEINNYYLVCTVPRSGSGYLCDTLWRYGLFGKPDEYFCESGFHPDYVKAVLTGSYLDYVNQVKSAAATPNGVCGIKIMWKHLALFVSRCRAEASLGDLADNDVLARVFPGVSFIWLQRRDKVRQAVSAYKRELNGVISRREPSRIRQPDFRFSFERIRHHVQRAEHDDRQWEAFFSQNSITPLRIAYEDYTDRIEPVVQKIADFLGVGIPEIHEPQKSDYRKLSDSTSERWVERYLELSSGKTGSGAPSQTTKK